MKIKIKIEESLEKIQSEERREEIQKLLEKEKKSRARMATERTAPPKEEISPKSDTDKLEGGGQKLRVFIKNFAVIFFIELLIVFVIFIAALFLGVIGPISDNEPSLAVITEIGATMNLIISLIKSPLIIAIIVIFFISIAISIAFLLKRKRNKKKSRIN